MVEADAPRRPFESTNTLIVTKVPPALLQPSVNPSLKEFFEQYGRVEAWVPLTSFERVVVVFLHDEAAEQAKVMLDYTLVEGFGNDGLNDKSRSLLRVYRGLRTPLHILRNRHIKNTLPVPETDKNFLISPPGSPPVGWEQSREDPPNVDTLADDLAWALEQLSCRQTDDLPEDFELEDSRPPGLNAHDGSPVINNPTSPRDTLIVPHRRTESGDLPSILVSNTDMDDSSRTSANGLTIAEAFSIQRGGPVSRSPGSISQVKATVESMQGPRFEFPLSGPRIDRTPRPPIMS